MNETDDRAEAVRRAIAVLDTGEVSPEAGAAIRQLNDRLNGDADPRIREFARNYDPAWRKKEREGTPLDDRALELTAAEVTKREAHRELQRTIWDREDEHKAERWRRLAEAGGRPERRLEVDAWSESKAHELIGLRDQLERLDGDWRRANVQLNALLKRRDRWRADREARFLVDGRVVDLAGLHEWLASSKDVNK